jgi:hypothetical protein
METAIINWEDAYENELARETMEACETDDVLDFFEGDPDQLRIDGETVLFIDIQNFEKTKQTVIYLNCDYLVNESEIVKRLTAFYSVDHIFDKHYIGIESTMENMKNLKNGTAYRGGMGYTYALYIYKNK